MKRILFILSLMTFYRFSQAQQQYYVSSSYNDENGPSIGTTPEQPWKSLEDVNNYVNGNAVIHLKRGDVFYGTINLNGNTVSIIDYGEPSASKPVISGFYRNPISTDNDYISSEGNVYRYNLPQKPNLVVMNNMLLELGRTPNYEEESGGYMLYRVNTNNSILDRGNIYNEHAREVVVRTREWSIERKNVTSGTLGGVVNFENWTPLNGINESFPLIDNNTSPAFRADNYGYFFQNYLESLDQNGEWYYDEENQALYVYFSELPGQILRCSESNKLIDAGNYNDIVIENIHFEGANEIGVDMNSNEKVKILHCEFSNIGVRAIRALSTNDLTVRNCKFSNCLSTAVQVTGSSFLLSSRGSNCTISDCDFINIAPFVGMNYNADRGDASAIHAFVKKFLTIYGNTFQSVAKAAVLWQGSDVHISRNYIDGAVLKFSDFGAIYNYYSPDDNTIPFPYNNRIVSENVVVNCPGNVFGTTTLPQNVRSSGIYLDGKTVDIVVALNTVYNVGKNGIMVNDPLGGAIMQNTFIDNKNGILFTHRGKQFQEKINIDIVANTFYSTNGLQTNVYYEDQVIGNGTTSVTLDMLKNKFTSWGDFDLNKYGSTNPVPFIASTTKTEQIFDFGFEGWRELTGKDESSTLLPKRAHYMPFGQSYNVNSFISEDLFEGSDPSFFSSSAQPSPTNPSFTITRTNEVGPINNNPSIKINFSSSWPRCYANIMRGNMFLTKGRYLLKYKTWCVDSKFGITKAFISYNDGTPLTPRHSATFAFQGTTEHEFLFDIPDFEVLPSLRLFIQIDAISGTTWVDDIQLFLVSAEIEPNSNFAFFTYNPTKQMQEYPLPEGFDAGSPNPPGFVNIQPFYNALLFNQSLEGHRPIAPAGNMNATAVTKQPKIFPNPAADHIEITNLNPYDNWEHVVIRGIEGKQVDKVLKIARLTSVKMDLKGLSSGVYYATFLRKHGMPLTLTFIKN